MDFCSLRVQLLDCRLAARLLVSAGEMVSLIFHLISEHCTLESQKVKQHRPHAMVCWDTIERHKSMDFTFSWVKVIGCCFTSRGVSKLWHREKKPGSVIVQCALHLLDFWHDLFSKVICPGLFLVIRGKQVADRPRSLRVVFLLEQTCISVTFLSMQQTRMTGRKIRWWQL